MGRKKKNTVIFGKSRCFGTPERTLTSDLSLRRRSLYTTELLGRIYQIGLKGTQAIVVLGGGYGIQLSNWHIRYIFYRIFSLVSREEREILPWENLVFSIPNKRKIWYDKKKTREESP